LTLVIEGLHPVLAMVGGFRKVVDWVVVHHLALLALALFAFGIVIQGRFGCYSTIGYYLCFSFSRSLLTHRASRRQQSGR